MSPAGSSFSQEVHTKFPDSDARVWYAKVRHICMLLTSPLGRAAAHEAPRMMAMQPRRRVSARALPCMMLCTYGLLAVVSSHRENDTVVRHTWKSDLQRVT